MKFRCKICGLPSPQLITVPVEGICLNCWQELKTKRSQTPKFPRFNSPSELVKSNPSPVPPEGNEASEGSIKA